MYEGNDEKLDEENFLRHDIYDFKWLYDNLMPMVFNLHLFLSK